MMIKQFEFFVFNRDKAKNSFPATTIVFNLAINIVRHLP